MPIDLPKIFYRFSSSHRVRLDFLLDSLRRYLSWNFAAISSSIFTFSASERLRRYPRVGEARSRETFGAMVLRVHRRHCVCVITSSGCSRRKRRPNLHRFQHCTPTGILRWQTLGRRVMTVYTFVPTLRRALYMRGRSGGNSGSSEFQVR